MADHLFARKWQLNRRVFAMLFLLMMTVFICIFAAFNIFTNRYIHLNIQTQLDKLTQNIAPDKTNPPPNPPNDFLVPDISTQPPSKIGIRGEVIVLDSAYNIKGYDSRSINENNSDIKEIAVYLKTKNIDLSSAKYVKVKTSSNEYFISSIPDGNFRNYYFVYFVSVTGINNLVKAINLAMAVIVAVAIIMCLFIANLVANSVTRPIKQLSSFAEQIGKGHFETKTFAFNDKEFDELGNAMNESAEKLGKYDTDQRTFFQNVSHEFRTPLQTISCYAEGVNCGLMDPQQSSMTILTETNRLSEMVEDLLYISRVDSISQQIELTENDLRDTLALCANSQKVLADKNGISFDYLFDPEPVLYCYNEKHMNRGFSNLISNALRYAESKITLVCKQSEDQIEIAVIDDGAGISQEDIPHVFDRFYMGKDGKYGIGLAIVKSVVDLHHGQLTVTSNHGAHFTIHFSKQGNC